MKKMIIIIISCLLQVNGFADEQKPNDVGVNSGAPPYLFFLEKNIGDGLIVYEQLARKSPEELSIFSVMRTTGGKTDAVYFTAKVEELKEGSCSIRILKDGNDAPTVARAKELLGITSNLFEIHFRVVQGQMPKMLLSVKDSNTSE